MSDEESKLFSLREAERLRTQLEPILIETIESRRKLAPGICGGVVTASRCGRGGTWKRRGPPFGRVCLPRAVAVILVGPGRYGFDAGRGWARRPFIGSFAALVVGIGAGVALWVLLNGANPVS